MRNLPQHRILSLALLVGVLTFSASAQTGLLEKLQSGLNDLSRGMDYVGQKAGDLLGPGLSTDENSKPAVNKSRPFSETYPVGPTPVVSISNEFGEIRVNTWDDRVVQVTAEIEAGADSEATADQVLQSIQINVKSAEDLVEIRSALPERRQEAGFVSMEVRYAITIPKGATLITDNFFGDTIISGVGGLCAVEAQYGGVELASMAGPVKVRAHGEFPVKAHGLAQGGAFQLRNAQGEFSNIAGEFEVNCFRGNIQITDVAPEAYVDAVADGGSIQLTLAPDSQPDLAATTLYGNIESALSLTRSAQGNKLTARSPNADSRQRILLSASFGDIHIEQRGKDGAVAPAETVEKPFNDVLNQTETPPDGGSLRIEAAKGDVLIVGTDENLVHIKATRIVWVSQASKAPSALDALKLQSQRDANRLILSTTPATDLKALGCTNFRVDLEIQCPRGMAAEVLAQDGATTVNTFTAPVTVTQSSGSITAERCQGSLTLSNQNGPLTAMDCAGAIDATTRSGALTLTRTGGKITARGVQARTVIEAARGDVVVRNSGGDVRILALEGLGGDYDVQAENGNLSMVLAPEADAALNIKANNGIVYGFKNLPLTGTITRDIEEFHGKLKDGAHAVRLETQAGDIVLD
jgi:hypothetical protein